MGRGFQPFNRKIVMDSNQKGWLCTVLIAACAVAVPSVGRAADPAGKPDAKRPQILCTTTMMGAVAEAVGGADVEVYTLIPFGNCPGHFDLSPSEANRLRDVDLVLWHGFERFLDRTEPGPRAQKVRIGVDGNWLIPEVHANAVNEIVAVLSGHVPPLQPVFRERATAYKQRVRAAGDTVRDALSAYRGTPVVCAAMSRDWVQWLGFDVVATFPRDDGISVGRLHNIIKTSREAGAALVLDNRQSGGRIGRVIAREIGVPMVMLSNFPALDTAASDPPPYVRALTEQTAEIEKALTR